MMNWTLFFYYCALTLIAFFLTAFIYQYADTMKLIDIPNQRSSHLKRTPRGGGLSFVICFAIAQYFFYKTGLLSRHVFFMFFTPPLLIATLGFWDDLKGLSAGIRLICHFIIVFLALYWFSGTLPLHGILSLNYFLIPILISVVLFLVWFVNLYNFMDGIDGLAAIQALTVSLSSALFFFMSDRLELSLVSLSLTFPVFGFIFWNFPQAKIFMGDVGSAFLGFVIGLLMVCAAKLDLNLWAAMLIMNAVFIVDTSWTLLVRAIRGEKVYMAHRTHAYQHAAVIFNSHVPVTLMVLFINAFFLFPLAYLCLTQHLPIWSAMILAYLPLIYVVNKLEAGQIRMVS